jgi:diacylglycerol kinase (ATP)
MPDSWVKVIVNPAAGGGLCLRLWPWLYRWLRQSGLSFEYEFTAGPGDAVELARRAAGAGAGTIIAVGGDGTVNEVANGILGSSCSGNTVLGVIPAGTSCGFIRSVGAARIKASPDALSGDSYQTIDVGLVECRYNGRSLRRFFLNEASAGIGAAVVKMRHNLPYHLGRSMNLGFYNLAAYGILATYRNKNLTLAVDGNTGNFNSCYVIAANGQYFADGMRIAPGARLDDGLLNVVTISNVSKNRLRKIAMAAYQGKHINYPEVQQQTAAAAKVECSERLYVEADGELLGICPATFSIIPLALKIVVLEPEIGIGTTLPPVLSRLASYSTS